MQTSAQSYMTSSPALSSLPSGNLQVAPPQVQMNAHATEIVMEEDSGEILQEDAADLAHTTGRLVRPQLRFPPGIVLTSVPPP